MSEDFVWIKPLYPTLLYEVYKLYPGIYEKTEMPDHKVVISFLAIGYRINEETGERERGNYDTSKRITLEALLSDYILENSPIDKHINELEQFRQDIFDKNVVTNLDGFQKLFDNYIDIDENEGHTENIHTLHGGESEIDTQGPAK